MSTVMALPWSCLSTDLRQIRRLFQVHSSPICPVFVVVYSFPPGGTGSFLLHSDGSALSTLQFVPVFRRCPSAAGVEARSYSSHFSLIGAATEAAFGQCCFEMYWQVGVGQVQSLCLSSFVLSTAIAVGVLCVVYVFLWYVSCCVIFNVFLFRSRLARFDFGPLLHSLGG